MVLRTSAEAIRLLCRFGCRKDAEKAIEIADRIEKWLEQTEHIKSTLSAAGSVRSYEADIAPRALAVAYRAIGISQAHWARFTYNAETRTTIQTKAVQYLRKALDPRFEDSNSIEGLYALGLALAEMRDVAGAIKVLKRALSPSTQHKSSKSIDGDVSTGLRIDYGRERKLIPVWHLLALLLTTRSEFSAAEKACEAAFEQFGDPTILFGKTEENGAYRSEHLNNANGNSIGPLGIVDQMENFEKSGIIEVKMTQLALVEVVEGANAAVDGCDELLALYARLFGDQAADQAKLQSPATAIPLPKSTAGTIRGSIFRSKGSVKNNQKNTIARNSSIASSRPSTMATQATAAPAIQVTDEDAAEHGKAHHRHLFHHKHQEEKAGIARTSSKLQKRSANSLRRRSELEEHQSTEVPDLLDAGTNGTSIRNSTGLDQTPRRPSMSGSVKKSMEGGDRPLRPVAHNMPPSRQPAPQGHSSQPPKQDVRLPAPFPGAAYILPDPRFSKVQHRRHNVSLLVDIWVFISSLYTRAEMYEDARGAVNEALKLVETFEAEVAQETATSRAFAEKGWGGGKSVEELWADAFTSVS